MKSTSTPKRIRILAFFFDEGTDLELMSRTDIQNTPIEENRLGLTHFAFAFDSQEAVLRQTERLRTAGYTIAGEPHLRRRIF